MRKNLKWTREAVFAEAKKYQHMSDFQKLSGGACNRARADGYLKEVTQHFVRKKRPEKQNLTFQRVKAAAKKCKSRGEFHQKYKPEYNKALRANWLKEVCSHMPEDGHVKWNFASVKKEARRYKHRVDFMRESQSAYKRALSQGWLDDVTAHMKPKHRRSKPWAYDEVAKIAKKYSYRSEFAEKAKPAYNAARANDWLDDVCSHMVPKPYATKKRNREGL